MEVTGWGKYPKTNSQITYPLTNSAVLRELRRKSQGNLIARGLGRSYGDSALAPHIVSTSYLDHFIDFDEASGNLTCSAGLSLAEILDIFVPRGWFLPVTPGTKFVTVGGAIASDVHGKNHHLDGCFSEHVSSIKIATPTHGIVECSRTLHPELFRATAGGMGLTGIILEATFKLSPIQSAYINETTIKAKNLEEALALFEEYKGYHYSVAWIDCISGGKALGRSLLMLGEHSEGGALETGKKGKLAIPVDMPSILLNRYSIQAFNSLYYHRITQPRSERLSHYDSFFYPLDGIQHWNRMYGRNGFTQYQFVVPREAGAEAMTMILKRIASSKRGSFLAVLKAFGNKNANYLSFPIEGYTLALDFKLESGIMALLDELDQIVMDHGGRLYLTKDARMSEAVFKQSYSEWEMFMDVRTRYGANQICNSLQSQRLGL